MHSFDLELLFISRSHVLRDTPLLIHRSKERRQLTHQFTSNSPPSGQNSSSPRKSSLSPYYRSRSCTSYAARNSGQNLYSKREVRFKTHSWVSLRRLLVYRSDFSRRMRLRRLWINCYKTINILLARKQTRLTRLMVRCVLDSITFLSIPLSER